MEHSTHRADAASVPPACTAARAVLHDRHGHTVVAHYGSIPGEIAVCLKTVGLADRADYGVLELRGDSELLDRALVARVGEPPLASGSARRLRGVWHLRLGPRHTLLVGPYAALAAGGSIATQHDSGNVVYRDIGASLAIVGIVGPRATRLLAAAGLPGTLAVGAIGSAAGDRSIVAIMRESQRRYLALVESAVAEGFWARLLAAGEPLGAALVGYDALTLLDASSVAAG